MQPLNDVMVQSNPIEIPIDHQSLARASRLAAMSFVNGKKWQKRELAGWLLGSYRRAVQFAHRTTKATPSDGPPILVDRITALVESVRATVLATLEIPSERRRAFHAAVKLGHVVPVLDVDGLLGWSAAEAPGMKLHERVLAMFCADYLTNPRDYTELLTVCRRCLRITFNASCNKSGRCIPGSHGSRVWAPSRLLATTPA